MSESRSARIVANAVNELQRTEAPEALKESIARHQENLICLAESLLSAGVDEASVEESINQLFESYKAELRATILELRQEIEHG
ncbi:MAG: hypothetical protein E4G91_07460 [Candidatus Zixiibacteriota bacterium]|nr:MAG: hypothetical protein E4G91_07460 [candidate division Zixibacteria bacterium]